ncbi:MAG: hypothetical protein RL268_111 [Pseudomonadota bacterium]|jgi:hypothetical protein
MAYLGGAFDASQVEPKGDYSPVPPGEYKVQIITSDFVETANRTGHMLKLEMEIIEGEQSGRRLYDRLNLDNPSAQAQEIGQRTLSAICHAVGKLSVQDSDELHMQPMIAVVGVKEARTGKDGRMYGTSNEIRTYKALGSGSGAPSGGFGNGGMKPAGAVPAAGSGQSATAPWKRAAA